MSIVRDKSGREARLLDPPAGSGAATTVAVALPDGSRVRVPAAWLEPQDDGYRLPLAFEELTASAMPAAGTTVPRVEEELHVGRRSAEEVVRVRKVVRTHEERLRQELAHEDVEIERVAVNREVSEPPPAREEGDVLVVPLLEEQIVWHKRLVLREEVRIRKRRNTQVEEVRAPLRREDVVVEREHKP